MKKNFQVHVKHVPRPTNRRKVASKKRIEPAVDQSDPSTKVSVISNEQLQAFNSTSLNKTYPIPSNNQQNSVSFNSQSQANHAFSNGKNNSKTSRYDVESHRKDPNQDEEERQNRKTFIISFLALLLLLLFFAGTVTALVLISLPTSTNGSTLTTTPISYLWNTTGTTVAGTSGVSGSSSSHLNNPGGLAFDVSDALYVADVQNHRIMKYTVGISSVGTTVVNQTASGGCSISGYLFAPQDVFVHSNYDIYVSDSGCERIRLMTVGATSTTVVAGTGFGTANNQFHTPVGLSLDLSSGTIYVADSQNHRVMAYASGATTGTVAAGGNGQGTGVTQLSSPSGLYFDSASNSLIIANTAAHNVVRWVLGDTQWSIVVGSSAGTSGSTSTLLNEPKDVVLDSAGNVYVADYRNNRIQFFRSGQTNATTIVGSSGAGSNANQLNGPSSLALDSQLNLYVSDTNNFRVQRFARY